MYRAMTAPASHLPRFGWDCDFLWRDQLLPSLKDPIRRLVVPWLIAGIVVGRHLTGDRYDVVEIHEPSAGVFAVVSRCLRYMPGMQSIPRCVVFSHGSEHRAWDELRTNAPAGTALRSRSRVTVPATVLLPSWVALVAADVVICLNRTDAVHMAGIRGVPRSRTFAILGNGSPDLPPAPATDSHSSTLRVLFVGTWIPRKGTETLIAAWRSFAQDPALSDSDLSLTVFGLADDHPDASRLRSGMTARVFAAGSAPHEVVLRACARHDVFVLPSYFEGMPLSVLEAAAAGCAIVATALPGIEAIFGPPSESAARGAVLVPPGDFSSVSSALKRFAEDRDYLAQTRAAAAATVASRTWTSVAADLAMVYDRARLPGITRLQGDHAEVVRGRDLRQ
jgi:glycosyltransferase involved in cell wall biosynthesis